MLKLARLYIGCHDICPLYAKSLIRTANSMETFGISPLTIDSSTFNAWLSSLTCARNTKVNYRRMGITLWKFAARRKLSPSLPEDIVPVKYLYKPVVCWTHEELLLLMDTSEKQHGRFRSRCPKSLFWKAWILIGYETGIRFTDLHTLRSSQLRGNRLHITHHKTGVPQGKRLSETAVSLARELIERSPDGTLFSWALGRRAVFVNFKKLAKQAKLDGTSKWLRRSGATYSEQKQPGSAKAFLGHLSEGLARKFYIDATILSEEIPTPPPFIGTDSRTAAVAGSAASPHGHPSPFPGTGHPEGVPLGKRTA